MSDLFASTETDNAADLWSLPTPKLHSNWSNDGEIDDTDNNAIPATSQSTHSRNPSLNDAETDTAFLSESVWDNGITAVAEDAFNGDNGDNDNSDNDAHESLASWSKSIRTSFNPNAQDIIVITEIPEKEGLLFKHTNYIVKHLIPLPDTDQSNDRKVIRRYSDFFWLFEILLKKYPFRIIPELPPKRLNVNTSDSNFLNKRKQGLQRFINQIMNHPILKIDELVIMFLTVPTDLSSWRKQATYDQSEEFNNKKISFFFINLWQNTSIKESFENAELIINETLENFSKLSILIERFQKRYQQMAKDDDIFIKVLQSFTSSTEKVYSLDEPTILDINQGLNLVGTHISKSKNLLVDHASTVEEDILQSFKKLSDYLNSFKSLFERYRTKGGNQIEPLKKRLESNESKLEELNSKPDVKGYEIERLKKLINDDKVEILKQTNRDWLIKESLVVEFIMFQETQFQITKCFKDWIGNNLKFSELNSNNWTVLLDSLNDMPLSRTN